MSSIDRYLRPEIRAHLTHQAQLDRWWLVEEAALHARVELGRTPADFLDAVMEAGPPSLSDVRIREDVVRHDVAAFVDASISWLGSQGIADVSRHFHRGLTSSDVVDTANSLLCQSLRRDIDQETARLVYVLDSLADRHWGTARVGRTHGQWAMPTSLGHQLDVHSHVLHRTARDVTRHTPEMAMLSGPVGIGLDDQIEAEAASWLGLSPAGPTTQIVPRDRMARWIQSLATLATACEALALEVRHSSRSEISELKEGFAPGQKGSSAMPHKRNPIMAERICGLARQVRAQVEPALQNMLMWNERDISNSASERLMFELGPGLTHAIVASTADLMIGLVVDTDAIATNLASARRDIEQTWAFEALLDEGVSRDDAYRRTQG